MHHNLTVENYERMIRAGILTENDRVELIRGKLLEKLPVGDAHLNVVNRLNRLFSKQVGDAAIVSVQNPIRLEESEPEPDIALIHPEGGAGKPNARHLLLVIEVADSSLDFDRAIKLPLYAEAGIPEFWIVNLLDDQIEIYRQPQRDGTYGETLTLRRGASLEVIALPGIRFTVADVLG